VKRYRFNGLDDAWIFEAENEDEASKAYIEQLLGEGKTFEDYERYMDSIDQYSEINWTELDNEIAE